MSRSPTTSSRSTTVWSLVRPRSAFPIRSRSRTRATRSRAQKRSRNVAKVACGSDRHVISGGGLASGPFRSQRLVTSAPFDSKDAGKKPDDGWRVAVDNLKRKRHQIEAYAICSEVSGISYVRDAFGAKKRARTHIDLDCPDGEFALGGGVTHDIACRKVTLVRVALRGVSGLRRMVRRVDSLSRGSAPPATSSRSIA